jgi:hyperosmotically inducible periplasmic protein
MNHSALRRSEVCRTPVQKENDMTRTQHTQALVAVASLALALAACGDRSEPATKSTDVTPPQTAPQAAPSEAAPAPAKTAETPKPDPDAELAAKVKSAFARDRDLKMLPIDVRASNGAVTLYGTADNAKLRDKAVRAASAVEGVKSVNANLQIVKGS